MWHALQQRLLRLSLGTFEPLEYLQPWMSRGILDLLLYKGTVMQPARVVYGVGRPMDCHRNALEHATVNASTSAWFGFSLSRGVWWLHSWVMDEGGVVLDSGPPTTRALYFGVRWGNELYNAIPKRQGAMECGDLPPVLKQSMFTI